MSQSVTDSFRNITRYLGQDYRFAPTYIRPRDPTVNDVKPKEQQGFYPITSFWSNSTNGNLWVLVSFFNSPVQARWELLSTGTFAGILDIGLPAPSGTGGPISPDINGLVNFTSTLGSLKFTGTAGGTGAQNINSDVSNFVPATPWTPTIFGSGAPGTFTPDTVTGFYTQFLSIVFTQFTIIGSFSNNPTGNITIGNFPVTINGSAGNVFGSCVVESSIAWPATTTSLALVGNPGTKTCIIYCSVSGGGGGDMQAANGLINIQGTLIYLS